jgi:hypothetical protein
MRIALIVLLSLACALGAPAGAAVPSAPGVAGVRVREVMSRGPGPRTGAPPPEGVDVGYPPIPVHVHHLRHKLMDGGATAEIHTVRGVGYLLAETKP